MTKNVRLLLTILALAGLASALASLYVHYQLLTQPGYLSFCDVNATVSCTQVYQSRYAYLAGVPVALLGALSRRLAHPHCPPASTMRTATYQIAPRSATGAPAR